MSNTERHLYEGGRCVGNVIGWVLNRAFDSLHQSAEERQTREMLRPGDPNRQLPTWQVEICERTVHKTLAYLPDAVARVIKQPTRQLCFNIILYEKQHRKSLAGNIEEMLGLFLLNLLSERLDNRLIGAASGEKTFSVPVHTLHNDVADFIDSLGGILAQKTLPPDGRPFSRLMAKFQYNLFVASGIDPNRWEESRKEPVWAGQAKGKSAAELVDRYLSDTPFTPFFNTSLPVSIPLRTRFEHMHIVAGSGHG